MNAKPGPRSSWILWKCQKKLYAVAPVVTSVVTAHALPPLLAPVDHSLL